MASILAYTDVTNPGWHHVAVTRSSNTIRMFIGGVIQQTDTFSGSIFNSSSSIAVGNIGSVDVGLDPYNGFLDEFRITVGLARWTANFTPPTAADTSDITRYRFVIDAAYLPIDISAIPSIKEVKITPAIVSLGEDLGQRASLEVIFRDHQHIFATEAFTSGTFWGKFRARYGLRLTGFDIRLITGKVGDMLANMETRHLVIDGTDGPNAEGEFKIIAKDFLKLLDGDRAQAPRISNGFLTTTLTLSVTSFVISP
jgi:hypothetical protein